MPQILLLNPIKGTPVKTKRKAKKMATRTAAQKRATKKLIAYNKARRSPVASAKRSYVRKAKKRGRPAGSGAGRLTELVVRRGNSVRVRANPVRRHRRRNPIHASVITGGMMGLFKGAAVQAIGGVAIDAAFGQVKNYLPTSMQRVTGTVGIGDAVKAIFTAAVGKLLSKPTKGLSMKAAQGSLTVQMYQIASTFIPASMPLGYAGAGMVVPGQARVGPNIQSSMQRYTAPGQTPLLNRYTSAGSPSPILSQRASVMSQEGVTLR